MTAASLCIALSFGAPADSKEKAVDVTTHDEDKQADVVTEEKKNAVKVERREGRTIKDHDVYLGDKEHVNAPPPAYSHDPYQPAYGSLTSDPLETAIGYVYYYVPTAENYLPKYDAKKMLEPAMSYVMSHMPDVRSYMRTLVMPRLRRMVENNGERLQGYSNNVVSMIAGLASTAGVVATFPALAGRKKREISNEIDESPIMNELAPLVFEHEVLEMLGKHVDKILKSYMQVLAQPECAERFMCESGDMTNKLGGSALKPILKMIEPFVPESVRSLAAAFRRGYKDRSACRRSSCPRKFF